MRINNNLMAMNTHRQLGMNNAAGAKSTEKLSSGLRINRAGDDAAGLSISEKMRGQIRGLNQASSNAQDGISMIQTAEGALGETHAILQRMRELAVQSSTDTNTSDDRNKIQSEVDQLAKEITRISNTTEFNTQNLMAGGLSNKFHIGANEGQNVDLSIGAMDAESLGIAGSNIVQQGAFGANGSGITGVANLGKGLDAGADYKVSVTNTAASQGSAIAKTTGTGTAVETGTVAYTGFTGTSDTTYTVKVTGISADANANKVSKIQVSKDNGVTWGSELTLATDKITFDGLEYETVAAGAGTKYQTGDTFSLTANASKADIKLMKGAATIGDTVTVRYGATTALLGDPSTGKTLSANLKYSTLATADTLAFTVAKQDSTKAAITNGVITNAAETKAGIDVSGQKSANEAITKINDAITKVSEERSKLGALQNRLDHTIKNLDTSSENLQASESRIRDVDMAKEMMASTRNNILAQAANAMLAQANQAPQAVLQLLR